MFRKIVFSMIMLALGVQPGMAADSTVVQVSTVEDLVNAVAGAAGDTIIELAPGTYQFQMPAEGNNALPRNSLATITLRAQGDGEVTLRGLGAGNDMRLANPARPFGVVGITISNFCVQGDGGAFLVDSGNLVLDRVTFQGNTATGRGGAIAVGEHVGEELGGLIILDSTFDANGALGEGGAIFAFQAARVTLLDSVFRNNVSDEGGAISVHQTLSFALIISNVFLNNLATVGNAQQVSISGPLVLFGGNSIATTDRGTGQGPEVAQREGTVMARHNSLGGMGDLGFQSQVGAFVEGGLRLLGNAVSLPEKKNAVNKTACDDRFGIGSVGSDGYNVVADDSCNLDGPGDQPGTDPVFAQITAEGIIPLTAGSPAIDAGLSVLIGGELPCSYKDIRGLARPQDGDGDGTAECDAGAWEQQAGEDLSAAASGAYFDAGRDGEGIFVEMLGGGLALVYVFSYTPDGTGQAWFLGVGEVVGNSIVVDEMGITRGGIFGEDFDPADVERIAWGSFSVSLPDCEAADPGVMVLTGNADMGYEPLIVRPVRLVSVLACPGARQRDKNVQTEFSGSWFDPDHDGEGFIIEVISTDTVVVQWFTYDDKGNQFWIQGVGSIDGKTITVKEAFFTRGTAYGSGFDPDDVERVDWGTLTIEFANCTHATANYVSVLPAFGSGSQSLMRITTLDGLPCAE